MPVHQLVQGQAADGAVRRHRGPAEVEVWGVRRAEGEGGGQGKRDLIQGHGGGTVVS